MRKACELGDAAHSSSLSRRRFLARRASAAAASFPFATAHAGQTAMGTPPWPSMLFRPMALWTCCIKAKRPLCRRRFQRDMISSIEREALVSGQTPYAGILSCASIPRCAQSVEYAFDSGSRRSCSFAGSQEISRRRHNCELRANCPGTWHAADHGARTRCLWRRQRATLQSSQGQLDPARPSPFTRRQPRFGRKGYALLPGDPLANAIRQNVVNTVAALKLATPILDAALAQRKLKIVGGIYRLASGRVEMVA